MTLLKITVGWYSYCFVNQTLTGYLYGRSEAVREYVDFWANAETRMPEGFAVLTYLIFAPILIYGAYVFYQSFNNNREG
jgi:hypothetical protein